MREAGSTIFALSQAGINVWTSHGPYGGEVYALAIDPTTPSTLYAGTAGAGVFHSTTSSCCRWGWRVRWSLRWRHLLDGPRRARGETVQPHPFSLGPVRL